MKEQLIETIKRVRYWALRECSMCGCHLAYVSDGENLGFDGACDCTMFGSSIQNRDWSDLDFYLDPKHGHIDAINKYIEDNAEVKI